MKTGVGDAIMVTARSASAAFSTSREEVDALFVGFGSAVVEVVSAELRMTVPNAVVLFTFTTMVNFATAPLGKLFASVQRICPVDTGVLQLHEPPASGVTVTETNVVLGGVC